LTAGLADVPRVVPAAHRKPLWLLPNLLSLDAPLVAVAWLYVFLQTWRLYHPWEAYVSLGLAVWGIYVADRLLDASLLDGTDSRLEARHHFHRRYRRPFRAALIAALLVATAIVVTRMPMTIYKHLLVGAVFVAGFFGLSMVTARERPDVPYTKNILAGVAFAFGVSMTAHLYRFEFGIPDLITSREFVCFAVLCILNISAIDLWEHAAATEDREIKASDELALTLPLFLLSGASIVYALMEDEMATRPFFYSILTGAALLYVINRNRSHFGMDALRVFADLALLAPVLVFWASTRG
jgi:hypothetical protein